MDITETSSKITHYSTKPLLLASALLLTACGGSDSDSTAETTLSSAFNLSELTAANLSNEDGSGSVRQMKLSWESATINSNATGITYTVCGADDSQENGCTVLAEVSDTLSTTITLDSLIGALSQSYFIIASNGSETLNSSEMSLEAETVTEMIGYFKASNAEAGDSLGYKVAMSADGNTLAVGAYYEDSSSIDDETDNETSKSGAVYIFSHDDTGWSQTAYLKADNPSASDNFGKTLAISADGLTVVVGAHSEDSDSTGIDSTANDNAATAGAAYIFTNASSTWIQSAYLKASNTESGDQFGSAVAVNNDGSTVAIGAPFEDSGSIGIDGEQDDETAPMSGAVYIFNNDGSLWEQTVYIKSSNSEASDFFGTAVALDATGNTLIVSARGEDSSAAGVDGTQDNNDITGSGAAYIFSNIDSTWQQTTYLKASSPDTNDNLGYSVSMSDDATLVSVSAYGEDSAATGIDGDADNDDASGSGAVYLFAYNGSSWSQSAYVKASNTEAGDSFGRYSAELSGDGKTLAVGAHAEDSPATGINGEQTETEETIASSAGAVYLYRYANDAWSQTAYIKASNTTATDKFGISVALSEDGSSLAVGANGEDSAATTINGNQVSEAEDVNYASGAGAVYLY